MSRAKKSAEPSKASLEEVPEIDFSRYDLTKAKRGRYVKMARRSLEIIVVDKKWVKTLGGPEGVVGILAALASAVEGSRKKRRTT